MKFTRRYLLIVLLFSCFACEKVIQVDLNAAAPQIVIEGEILDSPGPYQVRISKTTNFSSDNVFPTVSGAVVKISDNTGHTDSLIETSPGTYSSHTIKGKPGNSYTLSVAAEGKEYTAVSTMPQPVRLDSISLERIKIFNNTRVSAVVNLKDPPGLGNDYQLVEYINGVYLPETFVLEDRLYDGKNISRTLYSDSSELKSGDNILIKMYCIDANIYSYFRTFRQITNNGNQSASPANPNANISNGALGYFSAHTSQAKQLTVR
jgi:hypothetical protein